MYPGHWAVEKPEAAAVVNTTTGEQLTWRELNDRSNQVAQLLAARGLTQGSHVALMAENRLDFFVIAWGVLRSGMYLTCVNRYLTAEEAGYIIDDSGSEALFISSVLPVAAELTDLPQRCTHRLALRGGSHAPADFEDLDDVLSPMPTNPIADERMGDSMLYSSGTTGRPKGIKRPLTGSPASEGIAYFRAIDAYGFDDHTRYLSPAPLYHAAPFGFCMRTLSKGGSVFMMERFDEVQALQNIERYSITHSQWVPTMFIRMLKLDQEERQHFDLSSHVVAIHAAAPCPVEIKHQMMDWWGPILWEYYAGTERNGSTIISPEEWLERPGSVGKAQAGPLHICDEDGNEMPAGEAGTVYFEQEIRSFDYHNAPEKTASASHPQHDNWTSLGDVGYLDEDGYLFLTDRKAYMIISGGVNIYPQEIEDVLILHPAVGDVAVFGVPHPEFGEEVKAVVEPLDGEADLDELRVELEAYARQHLARYKVPRSFDFVDELPRLPTGKLYKRKLRDAYWNSPG
ncbi:MAG: acyl-CoA synthetase [Actinomycetia bacterium]|nr:acyl-CoA synthetase [Actinomycetes bacterium]